MTSVDESGRLPGDDPIEHEDQDLLRRAPAARAYARDVLGLDPAKELVVAVLGPWGADKTSFVNLAREQFADDEVPVVDI